MTEDAELATEKASRVQEWRADVLAYAKAYSSSFTSPITAMSIEYLFETLSKVNRHDMEACLRVTRALIAAIIISGRPSSERARLLERCSSAMKELYRDASDKNPFSSLLYEPLKTDGVPAIVYEIRRFSTDLHNADHPSLPDERGTNPHGLHVLRFLIAAWDGTLIALPDAGSVDLSKTLRSACLRLAVRDSGNDIFQQLRPLLSNQLNSRIRPSMNLTYSMNILPNVLERVLSSPSRRRAILASDGPGFTAFVDIAHFHDAVSHLPPRAKHSQNSPLSATPSPSSLLPRIATPLDSLTIELLAAGCAWSLEIGRNSVRLTLLDSDGSREGDGYLVDAAVEVGVHGDHKDTIRNPIIRLPKTKIYFPSHPRYGTDSIYLSPCFPSRPSVTSESGIEHKADGGIDGFDDTRLYIGNSDHLLLTLVVKLGASSLQSMEDQLSHLLSDNQRSPENSSPSSTGDEGMPYNCDGTADSPNDLHRRTASLPILTVSGPEDVQYTDSKARVADVPALHPKRPRALPKPPGIEVTIPTSESNLKDDSFHLQSRSVHSKQRSLPDIGSFSQDVKSHPNRAGTPNQITASSSLAPGLRTSSAVGRPLPNQPSLRIDTVNLDPSASNVPPFLQRPGHQLYDLDVTPIVGTSSRMRTVTPSHSDDSSTSIIRRNDHNDVLEPSLSLNPPRWGFGSPRKDERERLQTSLHPLTPVSDAKDQRILSEPITDSGGRGWRSQMVSDIEESFGARLPANRFSEWQGRDDSFTVYPITTRYLAQYLHWWKQESDQSNSLHAVDSFLSDIRQSTDASSLRAIAKQAGTREILVQCLLQTEQSSYRHFANAEFNRVWSTMLRRCLYLDEQDLAFTVSLIIRDGSDDALHEASAMESRDLLELMDVLQSLIDRQYGSHRLLERFLQRIVNRIGILPKYLFLSSITRIGDNPIAGGGFADVWKGKAGEHTVALKVIRIFGLTNPTQRQHQEFCKEAMIWRQFRHQNILPFYGVCMEEFSPRLALVSPWMQHGDVITYLKKNDSVNRIALIAGTALGLLYLHTLKPLVVHGDLRGANILVDDRGRAKLADFGLAKIVDSQVSTVAATSFNGKGAMRWQSPELLDSSRFDAASTGITTYSDVYAFAAVCLEVFTEEIPFSHLKDGQVILEVVLHNRRPPQPAGDSLAARRGLSDKIWSLMERCWSTDPYERPDMQFVVLDLTADCP